jgi:hypothetical protein
MKNVKLPSRRSTQSRRQEGYSGQYDTLSGRKGIRKGLILFHVIPAKAGIQGFNALRTFWTPVFTGVTTEFNFFIAQCLKGTACH